MVSGVILVVEDESIILLDVEHSLEEAGFKVIAAYRGGDAIRAFDRDPEKVAALVTDIRLGDGPDGWEVARHMRSVNPNLPVIYTSGDGAVDWPSRGVPNSVMIEKPFVMAQIVTGLATLLNQASAGQPSM
ncbi:response regulator [Mesorhizobium sp. WSM3876]|uniref:response regulator n=1 Tax=Mesorhizobium sp. WSM3876 TaxID=422277 RepID=UPI000BAF252B|nr:response regulator [Mesorhizobium sp. WSM3876]PBB88021.1 response regulator [Mesorhizobium sp. WSM3876]